MDDEEDNLNLTRRILEKNGFQVVTASNSEETLLKAEAEIPNRVLLDVVMSRKTGLEVCKILKSQTKTKHVPIVMFTALGRDVDRKMAADAGADGYFTKPFTPEALIAEVKQQLEKARGEKFSEQLGVTHETLQGRKILLEFDPSTPFERFVRDFVMESIAHTESSLVLTKRDSTIRKVVGDEKRVEFVEMMPGLMLSPLLEKHREGPLSLVYDNLTDLALSTDFKTAYAFASNAIEQLSNPRITALILLNPLAHEQKDIYGIQGLFSNQITYGKEGITKTKTS